MSVQFIDPWKFLYELNEHRMKKGTRAIHISGYLQALSKNHCKDIIRNNIPFSLENYEIRKQKLSSCTRSCQEVMARLAEDKNILESFLNEKGTKEIVEGHWNICGMCIFQVGTIVNVHCIFAES